MCRICSFPGAEGTLPNLACRAQANTCNRLRLNLSKSWSKVTILKPAASAVAANQASVHKCLGSGAVSVPNKLCTCASKPSGSGNKPTAGVVNHCW